MSVVLYIAGAIAMVVGAILVAAGIPVKEFSFGNTLILAGAVAIPGGLIVLGLAAVIAQLNRIADMLGARPAARTGRSIEPFEAAPRLGQGPGQIPFPPKPKAGAHAPMPAFPSAASHDVAEEPAEPAFAPLLRNPEHADQEPDEAPLMPRQTDSVPRARPEHEEPPARPFAPGAQPHAGDRAPAPTPSWRTPAPPAREPSQNFFDAMWPAGPRTTKPEDRRPEPQTHDSRMPEAVMREPVRETVPRQPPVEPKRPELPKAGAQTSTDVRAVPVLKSGVIDGMGYTLYVDGSIEAELPSGTLRFESIGALREHLEKNGG